MGWMYQNISWCWDWKLSLDIGVKEMSHNAGTEKCPLMFGSKNIPQCWDREMSCNDGIGKHPKTLG